MDTRRRVRDNGKAAIHYQRWGTQATLRTGATDVYFRASPSTQSRISGTRLGTIPLQSRTGTANRGVNTDSLLQAGPVLLAQLRRPRSAHLQRAFANRPENHPA